MDRRRFIVGTGGLILSGAASGVLAETSELAYPNQACQSVPQVTPGPFLTPDSPLRSDIREGLPGTAVKLRLKIVDDIWCQPVEGAVVDIWQCDAAGRYSGVENIVFDSATLRVTGVGLDLRDQEFLRGHQISDGDGMVEFTTIFPGWYVPRIPHIHARITWRDLAWTTISTQLFLPGEIEREVYQSGPYAARGQNPIDLRRDLVVKGNQKRADDLTVHLDKDGDGFIGSFEIAAVAL